MKPYARTLLALAALAVAFGISGCTSKQPEDSSIPWGRPAGWEGQVPGMGEVGDTSGVH
jgi:hypothetical protein